MVLQAIGNGISWVGNTVNQTLNAVGHYGIQAWESRAGRIFSEYVGQPLANRWPSCLKFEWNMRNACLTSAFVGAVGVAIIGSFLKRTPTSAPLRPTTTRSSS